MKTCAHNTGGCMEVTWGVAFEVRGKQHVQHALEHLYVRENQCGGYYCMLLPFHPRRASPASRPPSPANSSDDDSDRDDERDSGSDSDSDPDLASDSDLDLGRDSDLEPITVLSFTATSASSLYMGPADVSTMATQVVAAEGRAGPNSEYVLRTAEYVRHHIPEDRDMHLFELEQAVRERMVTKQRWN
nr:hypothetical protein BaRGS_014165 [Batillaria attramentaria]